MAVYVRGSLDLGNVTRTKISSRAPLYTKNGVEIRQGYESTDNIKTCGYEIRVDSCIELNETLQALTIRTGIGIWKIKRIEIHNPACGAISIFRWHNPDGHGKQLHFWSATYEGTKRLYPDIPISEQEFYLGEFKESFAHCTCHEEKQRFHGCVLEKSARKPIK
ncbi:MAG: hypothetical protein GY774_35485 [Planctomycetes bacterium]|nr:hypothetical protein [Planctomycetota bacterium]